MRAYTIHEIDALREAFTNRQIWGSYNGPQPVGIGQVVHGCSMPYNQADLTRTVEQQVRTAMMAGITADDLFGRTTSTETLTDAT